MKTIKRSPPMNHLIPPLISMLVLALLPGCLMIHPTKSTQASSVVQFLYPSQQPVVLPSVPTLNLPLRVGIAFAPPGTGCGPQRLSETEKARLLRKTSADFRALPYVSGIEIIPTTYLRPGGSFDNLDQLRSMLAIDVIVLLAYDQTQVTTDTPYTLSYWTIVGAYMVPAQKNDTATLMEAVVYDIASRRLLFRASGTSLVKHHSTLVGMEKNLMEDSRQSFAQAAEELTVNLKTELNDFKVRIKETPEEIRVTTRPGYSGLGALDGKDVALMIFFVFLAKAAHLGRRATCQQ
ncbi:MAG: rhombotarget lipoprotein [Opitutaceae bacterium]|nr:rhombotarget lipoprotein [Opitutaceae bacterium]